MELIPKLHAAQTAITTNWQEGYPSTRLGLCLGWDDLTGTLNASFVLEFSNDKLEPIVALTVAVTTATNAGDRYGASVPMDFRYWRQKYVPGGVTGGTVFSTYDVRG